MSVDERHIFGAQSLRELIEIEKQGGPMNLTRDEYLLKIQDLIREIEEAALLGVTYVDYVAKLADGRVINDMSKEELAKLYTSANKAHKSERNANTIALAKTLKDRQKLANLANQNLEIDPVALFIARQPWARE